jgi:hypothetical protein
MPGSTLSCLVPFKNEMFVEFFVVPSLARDLVPHGKICHLLFLMPVGKCKIPRGTRDDGKV